jgi:hypothetical protein
MLANGTIARIAATGEGLPMVSGEVVGRVSKGVGLAQLEMSAQHRRRRRL